jgi:hypothetical protein
MDDFPFFRMADVVMIAMSIFAMNRIGSFRARIGATDDDESPATRHVAGFRGAVPWQMAPPAKSATWGV